MRKPPPVARVLDQDLDQDHCASNSQQEIMWEASHQHVRVRSAAGRGSRCLLLLSVSPCLSGLSLYWPSVSLRVCTEVLVAPLSRGSSFEMRWWADTEPPHPDPLFEVWGPIKLPASLCLYPLLKKKKKNLNEELMHTCLSVCVDSTPS